MLSTYMLNRQKVQKKKTNFYRIEKKFINYKFIKNKF